MPHPKQEEQRKEERQIFKDKHQVWKNKKIMFDTRPQNEGKIRTKKSRRHEKKKKKNKVHYLFYEFYAFNILFKLIGSCPRALI